MPKKKKDEAEEADLIGVSVRLAPSTLQDLDRLAADSRRTRSNMLRIIIEDGVKELLRASEEKKR